MKYFLNLFAPLFFVLSAAYAQQLDDVITIEDVAFETLRTDWMQVAVELTCNENPLPDARNPDFVENITVKVYLAFVRDASNREYDYYSSEVEIAIMERRDERNVYFYLPGPIVKRDDLPREPEFYYVEIGIGGELQKPQQEEGVSENIPNLEILQSFISKAESEGAVNEDLLMPIYLVSGTDLGRVSNLPVFLRRDPRD